MGSCFRFMLSAAEARFAPWLERVIVEGLNEWRRTI
jgi:hypothetical protein